MSSTYLYSIKHCFTREPQPEVTRDEMCTKIESLQLYILKDKYTHCIRSVLESVSVQKDTQQGTKGEIQSSTDMLE